MQLIADSGSTKTAWCTLENDRWERLEDTIGLNPHYIDTAGIVKEVNANLIPKLKEGLDVIDGVHFYGAGCATPGDVSAVQDALNLCFPKIDVHVEHDLLGAARSLCQREPGLVCILGTGSNSCYYDGMSVVDNISALGFILGDEGGGANLGRMIIRSYFYRDMPKDLRDSFLETYSLTKEILFKHVYHKPLPNRYIASFAKFASMHRLHPFINQLIKQNFKGFIECQLVKYDQSKKLPIHFIGSVSLVFETELREVMNSYGLNCGNIIKNPLEGLIKYHSFRET